MENVKPRFGAGQEQFNGLGATGTRAALIEANVVVGWRRERLPILRHVARYRRVRQLHAPVQDKGVRSSVSPF